MVTKITEIRYINRLLPKVLNKKFKIEEFDGNRIIDITTRESGIPEDFVKEITLKLSETLITMKSKLITAPIIREFVRILLIGTKYEAESFQLARLGIPKYDFEKLLREHNDDEEFIKNYLFMVILAENNGTTRIYKKLKKERFWSLVLDIIKQIAKEIKEKHS